MGGELVGYKNTTVLLPYGDRFRRFRRFYHQTIGTVALVKQFSVLQESATRRLLQRVFADPAGIEEHIRW